MRASSIACRVSANWRADGAPIRPIALTALAIFGAWIACFLVVLSVRIALAQQRSAVSVGSGSNSAPPPPGIVITATNASTYAQFLPPAADVGINHGMTLRVVRSKRLDWSGGFTSETEKYSGQVGLDKDDYITNYIAGMPFPMVSTTDPKAAIKIAYNWHMGPFMPDDFSLEPWGSFAYSTTDAPNSFIPDEENSYVCDHFTFLRFAHRTEVDPRPTLGPNQDGAEWKSRCQGWAGGPTVSPNPDAKSVVVRYIDPRKEDVAYSNLGSRLEVVTAPNEQCRGCHQPFWAYALPKTEKYSYRLLGTAPILACLTADQEPAGIVQQGKSLSFSEQPFQLRNAYILEMTPKSDEKLRTVVYIDTEAYVWIAAEFYAGNEKPRLRSHSGDRIHRPPVDISLTWRASSMFHSISLAPLTYPSFMRIQRPDYFFVLWRRHTEAFLKRLIPARCQKSSSINTHSSANDETPASFAKPSAGVVIRTMGASRPEEGPRTASRQRSRFRFLKSRSGPLKFSLDAERGTGTGGAYAALSGGQKPISSARVARFVRVTEKVSDAGVELDASNLTPNPFPSGKGNRNGRSNLFPREKRHRNGWSCTADAHCGIQVRGAES